LSGSRQLFDQLERRVLHALMLPGDRRFHRLTPVV
jgi:hypothetical protein